MKRNASRKEVIPTNQSVVHPIVVSAKKRIQISLFTFRRRKKYETLIYSAFADCSCKHVLHSLRTPGDPSSSRTFSSGAAKLSIPILDQAGPLVMISPANTYAGLTKDASHGAEADEPGKYYPGGTRNYARVVTADDVQGAVDAKYMSEKLGVKAV